MTIALAAVGPTFSHAHIAVTAAITAALSLAVSWWRLPRGTRADLVAFTVLAGASVYLWRASANMPQLNDDGLPGFSANDWLSPVITYLFLATYTKLRPSTDADRYAQAIALTVVSSLAVNVITI